MVLAALAADAVDRERVARIVHRAENVHGDAGEMLNSDDSAPQNKKAARLFRETASGGVSAGFQPFRRLTV